MTRNGESLSFGTSSDPIFDGNPVCTLWSDVPVGDNVDETYTVVVEDLAQLRKDGIERIAFLGVSELAEIAYLGACSEKLNLVGVYDDDHAGEEFMGLKVQPIALMLSSEAQRILVTAYDPALPMGERYLPDSVMDTLQKEQSERLVWVFGGAIDVARNNVDGSLAE